MSDQTAFHELDWEDVRVFAALARHRTLARAQLALKMRGADIIRRISRLERTLGRKLFVHREKSFRLSAAGIAALGEAAQMEMAACSLVEARDYVPPARTRSRSR